MTYWAADTCGCTLDVDFSKNIYFLKSPDPDVYRGHNRRCQDHEHLIDEPLYNAVVEENQRKNLLLQHAVDAHPKLARQILNKKTGAVTNTLHEDVEFRFYFTGRAPDRILNVTFSEPLTDQEKSLIEARFPNKVIVH